VTRVVTTVSPEELQIDPQLVPLGKPLARRDVTGMRGAPCLITAMLSGEGERVPFLSSVDPNNGIKRGNVELWMTEVEDAMKATLKDHIGKALCAYDESRREQWLLEWPGQVVIAADQVLWTHNTEKALRSSQTATATATTAAGTGAGAPGKTPASTRQLLPPATLVPSPSQALRAHLDSLRAQLSGVVQMVRGDLSALQRMTVTAIITLSIHSRDVVAALLDKGVESVDSFDWFAQMKCVALQLLSCTS
jgi:dynein heavy chain